MKPKYIFSSVFAVALMMVLVLPQLSASRPVQAAQPAAQANALSAPLPTSPPAELAARVDLADSAQQQSASYAAEVQPAPTAAPDNSIPLTSVSAPELQSFVASLVNNRPGEVVGVYAPGVFALPITQQPANDHNFISPFDGILTQYAPPLEHGVIGLLAHNYLSGRAFFNLHDGQEITLVYGDGRLARYRVTAIEQYQALSPLDPYSDFIDLADGAAAVQPFNLVYDRFYTQPNRLVFQTCIENNGDLSWGRLFVVAEPL